jgi:hypothetical protein
VKRLISILFAGIYLVGFLQSYWVLIDFHLKRDFYTQQYCIKLDAGITQCRASCYLEKKLESKRQTDNDAQIVIVKNNKYLELPFEEKLNSAINSLEQSPKNGYYQNSYHFQFNHLIFHPPKG